MEMMEMRDDGGGSDGVGGGEGSDDDGAADGGVGVGNGGDDNSGGFGVGELIFKQNVLVQPYQLLKFQNTLN